MCSKPIRIALPVAILLVGPLASESLGLSESRVAYAFQQEQVAALPHTQEAHIAALCDSGSVLLERQDYETARKVFQEALDIDRDHPRALLGMGRTMLHLPRSVRRALDYLTRAVELAPDDIDAHYFKAYAHAHLARNGFVGRTNGRQALDEIEIVLSLNPSHADAYYHPKEHVQLPDTTDL